MGWWLTLFGAIFTVVGAVLAFIFSQQKQSFLIFAAAGAVLLLCGSLMSPRHNIFIQKKLFSDKQYIRSWPSHLGGNDRLNLDNLATMKADFPRTESGIVMLLNVTPVEELPVKEEGKFEARDITVTQYDDSQKYTFNLNSSKSHKIVAHGRTFVVTLNKIKKVLVEGVPNAIEYEFGISEID